MRNLVIARITELWKRYNDIDETSGAVSNLPNLSNALLLEILEDIVEWSANEKQSQRT